MILLVAKAGIAIIIPIKPKKLPNIMMPTITLIGCKLTAFAINAGTTITLSIYCAAMITPIAAAIKTGSKTGAPNAIIIGGIIASKGPT